MIIDIVTVHPAMVEPPLAVSMVGRARDRGLVRVTVHDLRDFTADRHRTVDDYPYGGGHGMVMKPEPLVRAVEHVVAEHRSQTREIVLLCPQGWPFTQRVARELASTDHLVLLCGHYEGVDDRVRMVVTRELSVGDYILTGGEIAALAVTDAVVRLLPGVLGAEAGADMDSFGVDGLLEGPQYTRPQEFRGQRVPEVLLSGDHELIASWRRRQALERTAARRPDLLARASLTDEERAVHARRRDCQ